MAPDDLTDSELLREMFKVVTVTDERLTAHLKFHTDIIKVMAWVVCLAVAARAAGIF